MPGLFDGGSNNEQKVQEIAAKPPPYMANYAQGVNRSQPGQIDMLSQNLAAGGFGNGNAGALADWMKTYYTESPMMIYGGPQPAAAAAPAAPAAVAAPTAAPRAYVAPTRLYNGYGHYAGNSTSTGDDYLFGGGVHSR